LSLPLKLKAILLFGLAIRLHHHFRGAPIDYGALAAAAVASWIGVPGPGEPVLIAAGVFAAQNRLDIVGVLVVACTAATAGGIAGWLLGRMAGRAVLTAPGPLRRLRLKAVARGDEIFDRWRFVAILLAPSWVAGIHGVPARWFLPINLVSALLWGCGIGLGAYYVGPAVVDVVGDIGWVTAIGLAVLVLAGLGAGMLRRRRRREQTASGGG
jgi:membrane protein DedA with SNARE-associated domain